MRTDLKSSKLFDMNLCSTFAKFKKKPISYSETVLNIIFRHYKLLDMRIIIIYGSIAISLWKNTKMIGGIRMVLKHLWM